MTSSQNSKRDLTNSVDHIPPITEDSLKEAISRFNDFRAVHQGNGDYGTALGILHESLGSNTDMTLELSDWAEENFVFSEEEGIGGAVLLGYIIGLMAVSYVE